MPSLPSPIRLRYATAADLPLLGPLEQRAGARFLDSPHPYADAIGCFDAAELARLQRAGTVWVAIDENDAPVGLAIAGHLAGEPYLHELDVLQSHAGRGIGRALIRRVAAWAHDAGAGSLLLSTFSDVPWNAPFYARLGFEIVPLDSYNAEMLRQRQADASCMRVASRVMMRAPLERLLADAATATPPR